MVLNNGFLNVSCIGPIAHFKPIVDVGKKGAY